MVGAARAKALRWGPIQCVQGTVTYPPLLEHLEFLECSLKEGAAERLAKTGHSVKCLLSEQGNGYPFVLVSAMGISPLSQPLAVPRSRKVSFELEAWPLTPVWAICLDHRAGRDPKNLMLPPLMLEGRSRSPASGQTYQNSWPGLGTHVWCLPQPCCLPCLFVQQVCFSHGTVCSDSGTFMR